MKRLTVLSALLPALFAPGLFFSHMAERSGGGGGSKIEKELVEATDLTTKRGEDRQDYLARVMKAVVELNDKEWNALSQPAQAWFNGNADAGNAAKDAGKTVDMADFPDLAAAGGDEAPTRRRSTTTEAKPTWQAASSEHLEKGQKVRITNKRGKVFEGDVTDLDKDVVVVGEDEINLDRVDKVEIFHGTSAVAAEPADPMGVGSLVVVTTKRGKVVTGTIKEIDAEVMILDVDGKEEEYSRDRVESVKPAGGAAAAAPAAASTGGRRSSAAAAEEKGEDGKPKRSTNPAGVSVGNRIREHMADDPELTEEAVIKLLRKEGLEFKDASVHMIHGDCVKFLANLKAAKRLK